MTYVVDENCIKCKHMDWVEVCPVDCFYEGENMLVIHPDECIDCGVCEPECPVDAIHSDNEDRMEKWAEINRKYSEIWPVITEMKESPSDAKDWENCLLIWLLVNFHLLKIMLILNLQKTNHWV